MAFADYEEGVEIGRPVELFEFRRGATSVWRFTSAPVPVTWALNVYAAVAIERGQITDTEDIHQGSLDIAMPYSSTFARGLIAGSPDDVTTLTVIRVHLDDPALEGSVLWKGRVVSAQAEDEVVTIECESIFSSIRRSGLRAKFEITCRHALYTTGPGMCNASLSAHAALGFVAAINRLALTIPDAASFADGWFTGGFITAPNGEMRHITYHVGQDIRISREFSVNVAAQTLPMYAGCDHSKNTCQVKFNNLPNFGGFPYIPSKNPFEGSVV